MEAIESLSVKAGCEMKDELNTEYLFCLTYNSLLLDIAAGKINPVKLAKRELANRGLGKGGEWLGFDRAKKEWKVK
jgi:hypothetical protein